MTSRPETGGANLGEPAAAGETAAAANPLMNGAASDVLKIFLLLIAFIFVLQASRPRVGVANGGNIKAQHHGVIFVQNVVVVQPVPPYPVAESHEDGGIAIIYQAKHVFPRGVHASAAAAPILLSVLSD